MWNDGKTKKVRTIPPPSSIEGYYGGTNIVRLPAKMTLRCLKVSGNSAGELIKTGGNGKRALDSDHT